jgi:outer membrane protein OmpA-like peptidoglycan-associated protein
VVSATAESFQTIEGNTNDSGSREGFEVLGRTRGYAMKDFVRLQETV